MTLKIKCFELLQILARKYFRFTEFTSIRFHLAKFLDDWNEFIGLITQSFRSRKWFRRQFRGWFRKWLRKWSQCFFSSYRIKKSGWQPETFLSRNSFSSPSPRYSKSMPWSALSGTCSQYRSEVVQVEKTLLKFLQPESIWIQVRVQLSGSLTHGLFA